MKTQARTEKELITLIESSPLLLEQATELLSRLPISNDWALLSYGEKIVDYLAYAKGVGVNNQDFLSLANS
jgi:hypothetical protein|tara:strand:+ start:1349 stop:1561 length:213 start_codon:yes stop_codon:yes gene_type:complete